MGPIILYAIGFILLIIIVFSNIVARKWGEQLKHMKQRYIVNIINIMFLILFAALYIPNFLGSQINVLDGVTEQENRQIGLVQDLDEAIFKVNLYTRWISIFTSLVGWYATSNKFHLLICILNIIIGIVIYIMYGFVLVFGGIGNIGNVFT